MRFRQRVVVRSIIEPREDHAGIGPSSPQRAHRALRGSCLTGVLAGLTLAIPAHAEDASGKPGPAAAALDAREGTIIVTARRREEEAQKVPLALSVVDAATLTETYTINTSTLSQLVPTLSYSSPNPRNTSYTLRGLGSGVASISAANDGLEPGVGYYVDQVYHARPATAAFDFTDIDRVEVLRGPQGTLFGKNTTAGAINITTKKPEFRYGADAEFSFGQYDLMQMKAAVTGPLAGNILAFRLSGVIDRRDGLTWNTTYNKKQNDVDNKALRGQLLFQPSKDFAFRLIADWSSVKGECCVPTYWKTVKTAKSSAAQYDSLAAHFGYDTPSTNVFDRKTDIDSTLNLDTAEGGVSGIADWNLGPAMLTSVTAWRYWSWNVDNDRDYIGLPIQLVQRIPSRHDQYSQELRIASNGHRALEYVGGVYFLDQLIKGTQTSIYGADATYWLLGGSYPSNLLDGYGINARTRFSAKSYAIFGEATWHLLDRVALTGGLRYTYEDKDGSYDGKTFGGLATTNADYIKARKGILRDQAYIGQVSDGSVTGRVNLAYTPVDDIMLYVGFARAEKSGGINMSGLPVDSAGNPIESSATVRPEKNTSWEAGIKGKALGGAFTFALDLFHVDVTDYQANVVDTVGGVAPLRTYLANVPKVRSQGVEFDGGLRVGARFSLRFSGAYTDAKYLSYPDGPCPIERIGSSTSACDLSGVALAGTPKWSGSLGGEYTEPLALAGAEGDLFLRADANARTSVNGDASGSPSMVIPGYALVNASIGYRTPGWEIALFARNLFDKGYLQNVTAQSGNSGLILANPGDPRIIGVTLRMHR